MIHDMSNLRKEIAARLGFAAKTKFAENTIYHVAAHIGNDPAGERTARSLDEAKAYAKAMLEAHKANAKGKPVVVDVYPVVNYEPKPAVLTLRASRPGAKAKMAKWESTITKKDGKAIEEFTATLHGMDFKIEVKEQAGKPVATLYRWSESHGFTSMGQGNLQSMMNSAQRYAAQEAKDVADIGRRTGMWSSRPGAKAKFADDAREVAQEILRQLGGGRFMAMVGGKNAFHGNFGGKPGLQVDIGKGAEGGINRVIVKLDRGSDTYDMEFWRISKRGMDTRKVSEVSGVYADDLQRIFTSRTKFYTSLSRPGAKAKFGTNKRIIRSRGHEFLAEDEGKYTRISIRVDGEWEHATTVNTDNQTATEWIEANAKPGHPFKWLPYAMSRPGAKALTRKAN